MNSSTSSSESVRARRFLALAFGLAAAVESAFALCVEENRGRHEVDDRVHAIATLAEPPRAVLFGDSVSYGVLDAVAVPDDVLDLSNNQSIGAAGNYFLLQRLVRELDRRGAPPPAYVVLAMNPVSWASNLDSERFLEPYFVSVFHRPEEIESVARSLERPELVAAMHRSAIAKCVQLPSYLRRGLVEGPLRNGLRALNRRLQGGADDLAEEAPGGAALWQEAARAKLAERAALAEFTTSPVTDAYLPQIAALCRERGARLLVIPAPVAPSVLAAWRANGYWQSSLERLAQLAGPPPGVVVEAECRYAAPSDAAFYDGVHLVQSAKDAWAAALVRVLEHPEQPVR